MSTPMPPAGSNISDTPRAGSHVEWCAVRHGRRQCPEHSRCQYRSCHRCPGKKGAARRLAQPNLTAISGETAKFNAGGEVPIPKAVEGSDGLSYYYRAFGVVLEFVPTVLDDSKINLRVRTEVSEPDWGNTVGGNPSFVIAQGRIGARIARRPEFCHGGSSQGR